ncbi:hypothetical protein [Wenyingzhuangia sp. IMCC45574]
MKILKLLRFLVVFTLILASCSENDPIDTENPIVSENDEVQEEEKEEPEEDKVVIGEGTVIVDGIKYGPDYLVFEPQITKSDLGKWVLRKKGESEYFDQTTTPAVNDDYLEFEGNGTASGPPGSPLVFKFVCPKTGKYNLVGRLLQHFPIGEKFHDDHSNDIWGKLAGNFTSATSFTTDELKSFAKFYGRGKNWTLPRTMGAMTGLEIHHDKGPASYNLIKGEEYTFTIAGRSKNACIDYLMFYHTSLGLQQFLKYKTDPAEEVDAKYRPPSTVED